VSRRPRILLAEDEPALAEGIRVNLEAEGYEATVVCDGDTALAEARGGAHDLLILDVMMPGRDGFAVCDALRASGSRLPVLFLTAKTRDEDRIRGLEAGGDDYIGKPFHLRELLLRIRAILRRQEWFRRPPADGEFRFGRNRVDFRTWEAQAGGSRFTLSQKECMILKLLVERGGEVVTREEILERVWGGDASPTSRTVDNFIVRLRRYFEPDPDEPRHIHTLRGAGYRFTP
jgi:DNA-binding response OmpR family regulator